MNRRFIVKETFHSSDEAIKSAYRKKMAKLFKGESNSKGVKEENNGVAGNAAGKVGIFED